MNMSTEYLKADTKRKGNDPLPSGSDTATEAAILKRYRQEGLSGAVVMAFREMITAFHRTNGRQLPWRETNDPWPVMVSEVMLQQTQVERVVPKFMAFLECFPAPGALAVATLPNLLGLWQGLGYNRRALNLQRAARMIVEEWGGSVPDDPVRLQQLPGIGPYTAGAIVAFAFNKPELFLETNIRAALLHFFFAGQERVTDKELLPVAEAVLDRANPRDWYNALMDYGSDLKRRFPNPSRRSQHHIQQSRFEGSDRQVRGAVLRLLLGSSGMTVCAMQKQLDVDAERLARILEGMVKDGFLQTEGDVYTIK